MGRWLQFFLSRTRLIPEYFGIYDLNFIRFYNTDDKDIIIHSTKLKEKEFKEIYQLYNLM